MGLINNIREFFSDSKNTQPAQANVNEEYEKSRLAERIIDLTNSIKRINCFDRSVSNLPNSYSYEYELKRKSLEELQAISSSLENKLAELKKQNQRVNPKREALEASKWTGQKPEYMSNYDFDRFQRDDDGR